MVSKALALQGRRGFRRQKKGVTLFCRLSRP